VFGVDTSELLIVAILALLFIGPKELPSTMRAVGRWVGKVRGMARHFTLGIENMMREAELEEMDRKWREENERIMRDYPADADYPEPAGKDEAQVMLPLEPPVQGDAEIPPAKRPLP
jgi:sec-independent protein translocase protein TatB